MLRESSAICCFCGGASRWRPTTRRDRTLGAKGNCTFVLDLLLAMVMLLTPSLVISIAARAWPPSMTFARRSRQDGNLSSDEGTLFQPDRPIYQKVFSSAQWALPMAITSHLFSPTRIPVLSGKAVGLFHYDFCNCLVISSAVCNHLQ